MSGATLSEAQLVVGLMLTLALAASVTDLRTGLIPNWLTFPALLLGPGIAAAYGGAAGLCLSLLGILFAGGSAFAVYRLGGLGGGDVKLFAALAGLSGPRLGLEIELFALCCVLLWAAAECVRDHKLRLGPWLRGLVALALRRRSAQRHQLSVVRVVRLGGAIFAGTLLALAKQFW